MKKYIKKYRIKSHRRPHWDYGSNGAYFLTICTANREHYFGNIQHGKMNLNEIGILAEKYWIEIPNQFPFVELGNFVIMPNHIHGVLIIDKMVNIDNVVETRLIASLPPTTQPPPTENQNKKKQGGIAGYKNPMFHDNISRIIRWYKGRCTFEIRKIQTDFSWQSRFHDHIIRNNESFIRIQNYIKNNPANWGKDKFYR